MSEKEYIDELFKKRLHSREFEFDEKAWEAAEKLLDQQDGRYRGGWKKSLYGLLALLFVSWAGYVAVQQWSGEERTAERTVTGYEEQPDEKQPTSLSAEMVRPVGAVEETDNEGETGAVSGVFDQKKDIRHRSPSPALLAAEPSVAGGDRTAMRSASAKAEKEVREKLQDGQPVTPSEVLQADRMKTSGKAANTRVRGNEPRPGVTGGPQLAVAGRDAGFQKPSKRSGQAMPSDVGGQASSTHSMNSSLWMPERMEALKPSLLVEYEKDILKGKMELQQKQRTPGKLLMGWGVIAGGGYGSGEGLSKDDGSSGRATVLFAGLRYAHYLNSKFSVHGNLLYKQISNLEVEVIIQSQTFDFGFNNLSTTIRSRKLTYIELPVYLNYYTAGRYNFYAGAQYAKLAGVLSEKAVVSENNFESSLQLSKKEYGYRGHIESDHLSVLAGAEYLLNERVSVGLRYNQGLTDIANTRYVNNNNFKLNELKITLNINVGN